VSEFIIADSSKFYLNGTYGRWKHLATIHRNLREYMYFMDERNGQTYIEEITGGQLELIKDDELWQALANFIQEKGLSCIVHQ
jgi:hypothetical protein